MPEAFASAIIPADAAAVWAVVRDFDGLPRWHPAIESSVLETPGDSVGAVRHLTLGDGGEVREVLVALSDTTRSLTYEIPHLAVPGPPVPLDRPCGAGDDDRRIVRRVGSRLRL